MVLGWTFCEAKVVMWAGCCVTRSPSSCWVRVSWVPRRCVICVVRLVRCECVSVSRESW